VVFGKFHLCGEARIRFAENGMAITRYNFTICQCFLHVCFDLFFSGNTTAEFFAHSEDPFDHFLVSEAV
jgi:hypothetical protein